MTNTTPFKLRSSAMCVSVALLASPTAMAAQLYSAEGTSIDLYGAIAAHVTHNNFDNPEKLLMENGIHVEDPGSYIGISAFHELAPFTLGGVAEADLEFNTSSDSVLSSSEDFLNSRQVFVSIGHEMAGTLSIGKQESPYMQTDMGYFSYWAGGSGMMLSDELGSRRTANTIVWTKQIDNLYIGLQYQAKRSEDKITFGNGYNSGAIFVGKNALPPSYGGDPSSISAIKVEKGYGLGLSYQFDQGAKVAAGYNKSEGITGDGLDLLAGTALSLKDAKHSSWAVAATVPVGDSLDLGGRFESVVNDFNNNTAKGEYQNITLGANYRWVEYLRSYAGVDRVYDRSEGAADSELFTDFHVGTAFAPVAWGEIYVEYYQSKHSNSFKGNAVYIGAGAMF